MRRRSVIRTVINVIVILAALFPIYWGLATSFKQRDEMFSLDPTLIPLQPTLDHYVTAINDGILFFAMNSALVSAGTLIISLVLGILAGYALARFEFRGKMVVLVIAVAIMSIPIASLLVPTYTFMGKLGLINSRMGLALLYSAYQVPLTMWIMYGYFNSIPAELENAAMIDGYSRLHAIIRVVVPLSWPGLIVASLFIVTFAWNDFVVALTVTSSEAVRTLPIFIYSYIGFTGREWGPLLAAAMLAMVPVLILFIVFQKYFISGMTGGGVKG